MQPRTSKTLRVALAGAGMISWYHMVGWRKLGRSVRVVAVCDPDPARARQRAEEFGIPGVYTDRDAMFAAEQIDALDVASPRETHAEWVDAAVARGIDVLCQKPLTPTLAESRALVRRVEQAGSARLMVHENWRFRPWYRELKRWIAAGELGDVLLGRMAMITSGLLSDADGQRPALVRQPFFRTEAQLMIAEVLIHHLDAMRYLCGEMKVLDARTARPVADVHGESLAAIFLETASGAPVEVIGTLAAPGYPAGTSDKMEIIGSKASAVFGDFELKLLGASPRSERYDAAQGYQASFDGVIAHFVECLETGAAFETGPDDNLETLVLVDDAYRAAARRGSSLR